MMYFSLIYAARCAFFQRFYFGACLCSKQAFVAPFRFCPAVYGKVFPGFPRLLFLQPGHLSYKKDFLIVG